MRRSLLLLALLVPTSAYAEIITFSSPTIAATMECELAKAPKLAPLQRYEEAGVRVSSNEAFANRFSCDPANAFGNFGEWQPLTLAPGQTSYGPLVYWWADSAWLDVLSLSGRTIRGVELSVVERNSQVHWCSEIINGFPAGTISLCDGFSGWVNFADYGFADGLTKFQLAWGASGQRYFFDPYIVVRAIDVPEPGAFILVSLALASAIRRLRGA